MTGRTLITLVSAMAEMAFFPLPVPAFVRRALNRIRPEREPFTD